MDEQRTFVGRQAELKRFREILEDPLDRPSSSSAKPAWARPGYLTESAIWRQSPQPSNVAGSATK